MFFLGMILSVFIGVLIFDLWRYPYQFFALLALIPFFVCLRYYISILSTTKFKWKFYKVYSFRITKRDFDEEWFCDYMCEPCMRLIIKDLCYEYGYKDEYKVLRDKYSHVNYYLEKRKQELIEQVKRRNEEMS